MLVWSRNANVRSVCVRAANAVRCAPVVGDSCFAAIGCLAVQELWREDAVSRPMRRRAGSAQVSHYQAPEMANFNEKCPKNKQNGLVGALRGGADRALLCRSIDYNPFRQKYPGHNAPDGHTHTTPLPGQFEARGDPENGPEEQFWFSGRVPVARIDHKHGKNDRLTVTLCVPIIALARLCYIFVARV
jgi:hypothetical protein